MAKYALLVGISEYQDPSIPDLLFAAKDAEVLGQCLEDSCRFDNVKVLAARKESKDVTSGLIGQELDRIAAAINPNDTFFFYFSGHGVQPEGKSFLLPSDAAAHSPEFGLPTGLLKKRLAKVKCAQHVLIYDCCRSDSLASKGKLGSLLPKDLVADLAVGGGGVSKTCSMFSCSPGQCSFDWVEKGHGVFTWYLLEALRSTGWRGNQLVLQRVHSYVKEKVGDWAERIGQSQIPWSELSGSLESVVIAERPAQDQVSTQSSRVDVERQAQIPMDIDQEIRDLTLAVRQFPENEINWCKRARAYNRKGNYADSIIDCNEAIRINPDFSDAWCLRGLVYRRKRNYDQAIKDLNESIRLDFRNGFAWKERGVTYLQRAKVPGRWGMKRDLDQAIDNFSYAIRLKPGAAAYYSRGHARYIRGKLRWFGYFRSKDYYTDAIRDFTKVVNSDPYDAKAGNARGAAYTAIRDYNQAIRDYSEAIRLIPGKALFWSNRASAYWRSGNKDEAYVNFNKARELR